MVLCVKSGNQVCTFKLMLFLSFLEAEVRFYELNESIEIKESKSTAMFCLGNSYTLLLFTAPIRSRI